MSADPVRVDVALNATNMYRRCGIVLFSPEGSAFWCNDLAADIFGGDPAGLSWPDLLKALQYACRRSEALSCLPENLRDLQEKTVTQVGFIRNQSKPVAIDISLDPVREIDTGILRQVVLTLIPAPADTGDTAGSFSKGAEDRYRRYPRELYKHMERGAIICESSDDGLTFTVKDLNSSALAVCGTTQEEAVGKTVSEVLPGMEKSGLPATLRRVYASTVEERTPFFLEDGFGRKVWLDTSVFTLSDRELVIIFDDITVKYETEQVLRRSKEEWEKTFDALSDIVTIQDREMRIVRANKAAYAMFDLQFNEVIGKKCYDIFQGFQEPCEMCPVVSTAQDCCIHTGLIHNVKLGKTFDVRSSPIFDEAGELKWLVQIGRDVTREDSLERQLQQAMKMEAIGTLAGGIAHDFNNILSAIIGYGYIAKGKLEKSSPVQADIDQILAGGDRAADLVKQILTFARQENREHLQPLKIQYIIKEVLKLLRSSLPTTIELKQYIDSTSGPIMADPGQMHQLLLNLCTNARQAIGAEHGVISIRLGQCPANEVPLLDASAETLADSYLLLTVEDTGNGMEPQVLERIFDPFFTTRAKEHGTGLGLAVVHGIVKKHRGSIFAESEPGKGTTFTLYFPVVDREALPPKEIRGPEYRGKERIMIIDDEPSVGSVHKAMLRGLGYLVTVYSNSLEAAKEFRKNPNCCDLVLTDMTMPNMTGVELAREMLSIRPSLPIILITGYNEAVDKEKAFRIGLRDFLLKPVSKSELSARVREVLKSGAHSHS